MFKLHICMLVGRIMLLLTAIILYIQGQLNFAKLERPLTISGAFLIVVWTTLIIGMLGRIIPNKFVTTGAGKHFRPAMPNKERKVSHKGILTIVVIWFTLNISLMLVLQHFDLFNAGIALIIALIYSICDISFILFFCPFQKLFMRNKCCATCRIYNWDFFMTCTPLIPFLHMYSITLVLLSVAVLIRWEVAVYKKSFFPVIDCVDCKDRMCHAKRKFSKFPKHPE